MTVLNDLDRFHLVIDVLDRVPSLGSRAAALRQEMVDAREDGGEGAPQVVSDDAYAATPNGAVIAARSRSNAVRLNDDRVVFFREGSWTSS